jgi:hypothetical protein
MNRELLEKPFSADQIKQRQGGYGEILDYIEGPAVIQRLNEAFQAEWAFEIVEHHIYDGEVVVLGKLTAQGITKSQFGAKHITRAKDDQREVSIGDDLKAAATDCLKKCATLFGVGLHLYFDDQPQTSQVDNLSTSRNVKSAPAPRDEGRGGYANGNGQDSMRVTARQLSAIFGIAKGKSWSNKETREFCKNMFGKLPDFLTMREASALIDHLNTTGGRA